jgi:hypothetical protein
LHRPRARARGRCLSGQPVSELLLGANDRSDGSVTQAADEDWFAERQITAHNHASSANPLISPDGLATVARMLADGTITARIGAAVDLDGAGQVLKELRRGGLRGKAVIRL